MNYLIHNLYAQDYRIQTTFQCTRYKTQQNQMIN